MVAHVINGIDHKSYSPVSGETFKKAVESASTYDWEIYTPPPSPYDKSFAFPEDQKEDVKDKYPKEFVCKKTGLIASRKTKDSPVMFVKGKLLLINSDEYDIKKIIE